MTDISLGRCSAGISSPEKNLPKPPKCSDKSKQALMYTSTHIEYKGPFLNLSSNNIPSHVVQPYTETSFAQLQSQSIPKEFSWHKSGGNKIEDGSRNQGQCGCCWAMAFVSALGDRFAVKYNIKTPHLSTMQMVSCGGTQIGSKGADGSIPANQQCQCGGSIYAAGKWLEEGNTIGLESCWPYSTISSDPEYVAPNCPDFDSDCCADCCGNPESKPKFTVKKGSVKFLVVSEDGKNVNEEATINAIKLDIMNNGPVVTSFWVPPDFQEWWGNGNPGTNNIYIPKEASQVGRDGHAVVLSGWGESNGIKYWEMRNTWGTPGYCRFAMSVSTPRKFWCGIDIPSLYNGNWEGGAVSVLPGSLPDYKWNKGDDSKEGSDEGFIKKYYKGILLVLLLVLIGVGIFVYFKHHKKRSGRRRKR